MKETFNTEVIVLNRRPFREVDSQLSVFSKDFGKMQLVARGGRKITSKMSSHLEPLSISRIMVVLGRQYNYIGSALGRKFYSEIKSDFEKMNLSLRAVKLIESLSREGEHGEHRNLFKMYEDFLDHVNGEGKITGSEYYFFAYKLLRSLGFAPDSEDMYLNRNSKDILKIVLNKRFQDFNKLRMRVHELEILKKEIIRFLSSNIDLEGFAK